jgi:methionyl-tRNA synthetase
MGRKLSPMSFYVTTPIYYVNDRPHIGHCYTTLLADALARFQRLRRASTDRVFFLTGTDEHADKVVTAAAANNMTPQAWSDRNAAEYKAAYEFLGIRYDDFIRTTESRHKDKVLEYIRDLQKRGDVYLGDYVGWFDESQEEYLTETAAKEAEYKSPVTGRPLVKRTEKNYFFKLSAYQQRLLDQIAANPHCIQPEARRNEVLGRLRDGLQDIPISRAVTADPTSQWGIRMPDDQGHRIYVWIDALFNYLTAVDTPDRIALWPADVHLIAKDILWFHAVIWPCLLMALGRPVPKCVYAHSYWVREGKKMSKSLGNFVSLEVLRAYAAWAPNKDKVALGVDPIRWYLLTQGPLGATDADFSHAKFVEVYNADLANGIGNCASRVGNMIDKYFGGKVPDHGGQLRHEVTESDGVHRAFDWPVFTADVVRDALTALRHHDLAAALSHGIDLIRQVDIYINATRPFAMAKLVEKGEASREGLAQILYHCAEAVRIASLLLSPALPQKMAALWETWSCAPTANVPLEELAKFAGPHGLRPGQAVGKGEILFMRADAAVPAPA